MKIQKNGVSVDMSMQEFLNVLEEGKLLDNLLDSIDALDAAKTGEDHEFFANRSYQEDAPYAVMEIDNMEDFFKNFGKNSEDYSFELYGIDEDGKIQPMEVGEFGALNSIDDLLSLLDDELSEIQERINDIADEAYISDDEETIKRIVNTFKDIEV
jgi:hypothetical protein